MINIFKKIILKRRLRQVGFPYIKVSKDIIQKYKYTTRKNEYLTNEKIEFKILRSYYSGTLDSFNDERDYVNYGQLRIKKDNINNLITDIHNDGRNRNGRINFEIKDKSTSIYVSVYGGEI